MINKSILTLVFPGNLNLQNSPSHLFMLLSKVQGCSVVNLQTQVWCIAQIGAGISEMLVSPCPCTNLHSTNVEQDKDLKYAEMLLLNYQGQK